MKNHDKNGLPEMYKYYSKKNLKSGKTFGKANYSIFRDVIKDFNAEITKLLIEEGAEFKMPVRLGTIRIRKYKQKIKFNDDGSVDKKGMGVNWPESKKLWQREYPGKTSEELKLIRNKQLVYYLNEHTDGYRFILYWNKKGSNAKNRTLYSFVFTYSNNRHLASILKGDNKAEYYE